MPDETKVFDVSKPGKTAPNPTSRPIIMGHRPSGFDPVVNQDTQPESSEAPTGSTTPIHVAMPDEEPVSITTTPAIPGMPSFDSVDLGSEAQEPNQEHEEQEQEFHAPEGATIPPNEMEKEPGPPSENTAGGNFTPLSTLIPTEGSKEDTGEYGSHHVDSLPQTHEGDSDWKEAPPLPISRGAGPKRRLPKKMAKVFLGLLVLLAAGYLAIDAGLIKSDIKLPFHIFNKQKTSTTSNVTPPPAKNTAPVSQPPAQSAVPSGFASYKIDEANVSFAYPTAWGTPATTKDPGFSKRGGTNKTDGTHAFVVDFAANKDVQIALTSSKYLPASRAVVYYDFLQWCTGTNDSKVYMQQLKFSTADKVDTPSTITCDLGPKNDTVKKLDSNTIFEPKAGAASSPDTPIILGDLYTMNLVDPTAKNYPVLRVKDAKMTNGDDIKKLLATIKIGSSSNSTSSTTP